MYDFWKARIDEGHYTDTAELLAKLRKAWGRGCLTDSQLDELTTLAQAKDPKASANFQAEISDLWVAVRELSAKIDAMGAVQPEPEPTGEEVPEWKQPTGGHDAYYKGDKVTYKGEVWESQIDGNVWAPDVYPAGWKKVESEEEETEQ